MKTRLAFLLTVAMTAMSPSLHAQCTVNGINFTSYGSGCNAVFGVVPSLVGSFDAANCSLTLTINDFPGCCNTYLVQRSLAFGLLPTNTPLPWIAPGCTLFVQPDLLYTFPSSAGNTFTFPIPPGLPALTVYAQGADQYFTTIGLTTDFALTNGLAISIF